MIKSFEKDQPIFYRILNNCFKSNKIPHAFLLVGQNSSYYAHYIAKSLICNKHILACDECVDCSRIERHTYGDLIYYDGLEDSIKKEHIEYIKDQFSKASLEGASKIYILEHIENSNATAMNRLLKFLEEPSEDIYAIFTTNNINRILPTIQSRCQVVQLLPNSKSLLENQLKEKDLSQEDVSILSELFNSYSDCEEFIDSEKFDYLKNEVYHFIDDLYFHRDNLIINVQTHLLKDYKDKETIKLFLNMLVLAMKDLFHVKHNVNLIYSSYRNMYERINDNLDEVMKKIEIILDTEFLLDSNANIMLLIESMMYRL